MAKKISSTNCAVSMDKRQPLALEATEGPDRLRGEGHTVAQEIVKILDRIGFEVGLWRIGTDQGEDVVRKDIGVGIRTELNEM